MAVEFLARLCEAGVPVLIVDTLRTPEEHRQNLANGVSWTKRSKHLTGDAIDIVPYDEFHLNGPDKLMWTSSHPAWEKIGQIGEALGMGWGGRWQVKDMGHFEFPTV